MTARAAFPYRFDGAGRTAEASHHAWIRGLVEQVLFTAPGERVMRPSFGSGLAELVFAPNSPELAATVQFLVQAALQQWLADLILVQAVTVRASDATLTIEITYTVLATGDTAVETFTQQSMP